jgi:hypothetical protein
MNLYLSFFIGLCVFTSNLDSLGKGLVQSFPGLKERRLEKLRNRSVAQTVISIWTDLFCSAFEKENSSCFSLPAHCLPPGVRMMTPMLPKSIHIITADIEEEEEGSKASTVHPRLPAAFDSAREPNKDADQ